MPTERYLKLLKLLLLFPCRSNHAILASQNDSKALYSPAGGRWVYCRRCQMAEEVRTDAGIGESIGTAGTAVKDGIVSSLKGVQEIETEIVNLVRSTVSDTLQATGSMASETVTVVRDVVKGTLQATEEAGTGLIVSTTNVTQGLVMGARDVGGDVLTA